VTKWLTYTAGWIVPGLFVIDIFTSSKYDRKNRWSNKGKGGRSKDRNGGWSNSISVSFWRNALAIETGVLWLTNVIIYAVNDSSVEAWSTAA
jgi:hypothetical protein